MRIETVLQGLTAVTHPPCVFLMGTKVQEVPKVKLLLTFFEGTTPTTITAFALTNLFHDYSWMGPLHAF